MLNTGSSSSSITRARDSSLIAARRRSNVVVNLQHYDPNVPGPGEMVNEAHSPSLETSSPRMLGGSSISTTGDPHHFRSPSLGEIHQELEQEQEAQVVSHQDSSDTTMYVLWTASINSLVESVVTTDPYSTSSAPPTPNCFWTNSGGECCDR